VLVREIPAAQQLEVPGVMSQFWMGYRPTPEEPGRMVFTCRQTGHAFRAEPVESLCRILMQEVEQGCPHGSAFFEPLSRTLAAALVRRVAVARPVAAGDRRIERAVRLFREQHKQTVSMEEAIRATGLSRYEFFRRFRAAVGVSPYQYWLRCRLGHARRLILSECHRRSLTDIAAEAGFYDQAHLCRHFRRVFGQSPGSLLRAILTYKSPRTIVQDRADTRG
jgi:AraC-like DNA-binding protein